MFLAKPAIQRVAQFRPMNGDHRVEVLAPQRLNLDLLQGVHGLHCERALDRFNDSSLLLFRGSEPTRHVEAPPCEALGHGVMFILEKPHSPKDRLFMHAPEERSRANAHRIQSRLHLIGIKAQIVGQHHAVNPVYVFSVLGLHLRQLELRQS